MYFGRMRNAQLVVVFAKQFEDRPLDSEKARIARTTGRRLAVIGAYGPRLAA